MRLSGMVPSPTPAALQPRPVEVEVMRPSAKPVHPERSRRADVEVVVEEVGSPVAAEVTVAPQELDTSPASAAPGPTEAVAPPLDTSALSRQLQEGALRCYPAGARRFRQTGEAQVRFCLDRAGTLSETTLASSSGSALLDVAARECVVPGAAPFGPETFGRCFTLPVRFRQ